MRSGRSWLAASVHAQSSADADRSDPSTPTTIGDWSLR